MLLATSFTELFPSFIIHTTCPSPPSSSPLSRGLPGNTHIPLQSQPRWYSTSSLSSSIWIYSVPFAQHRPIHLGIRHLSSPAFFLSLFISWIQPPDPNNPR